MTVQTNTNWKVAKAVALLGSYGTASTSVRLMVYAGTIPDNSVWNTPFDLATHASNLLVGWTSFNLQRTSTAIGYGITPPGSTSATGTGTATWVALCYGPTSFTTGTTSDFIIGEPSLINDNGFLQLSTLDIVTGNSILPVNLSLAF